MNNKIMKRGSNIGGLVRYLFGKGDSDEHRDQRVIASAATLGIAGGTRLDQPGHWPRVLDVARDLDAHRRIAGVAPHDGWVWHCAISLPPGETLSDAQWADVARTAMHRLGFEADEESGTAGCRWIAVHHGPSTGGNDHIHVAVNLVREDLTIAAPGRDRMAMSRVCAEMERRFGLYIVPGRAGRGMPGYTRAAKERAIRRAETARKQGQGAVRVGRAVPETVTLARKVRAAATAATGEAEFLAAVAEAGILVRPRYGKGDHTQVVGYSVALPAADSGAGRPIWYGGGKLAADLSLPKLRARWTTGTAAARTTPPDALAAWQHAGDLAAGGTAARAHLDAGEPAGREAEQWRQAAERVEAVAGDLEHLPYGDAAAWSQVASDTAGLLSLLADHIEGDLHGDISDAAYTLAWSAQTPRHPHPDARDRRGADHAPARPEPATDLAGVARFVRAASRTRSGDDVAVAVAIAALVLAVLAVVRLIQAWHDQQQHRRQAAALDHGVQHCQITARAHAGAAVPPWQRRRYGDLTDPQLHRLADRADDEAKRLTELEDRTGVLIDQARAGEGPAAAQLHDRAAALAAAAAAEARIPAARTALDQATDRRDDAERRVTELAALTERGRLALRLQGTSAGRLTAELQAARGEQDAAVRAVRTAADRVDDLTGQASAPFGEDGCSSWQEGAAGAAHADLTSRWDAHLATAIDVDVQTASQRARGLDDETHRTLRSLAAALPHVVAAEPPTAASVTTALTAIRTEQAIRTTLPVRRAAHEQAQRVQHARAQRSSQPAPAARPDDPYRHRGHHHGRGRDGGPGR